MISHSWYSFGGAKRRSGLCKQARSPQQLDHTGHILISVPVDARPLKSAPGLERNAVPNPMVAGTMGMVWLTGP